MNSQAVERLESLHSIAQLKAQYCRCVDRKLWSELLELFAFDCRFEGMEAILAQGASAEMYVSALARRHATSISIHHCHSPEIVFISPNEANGIWAMRDYNQWPIEDVPLEHAGSLGFRGYGHYEESYRREGRVWRISALRLRRLRVDSIPRETRLKPVSLTKPR